MASFTGDGACDEDNVHGTITGRIPDAVVVVPPRLGLRKDERRTAEAAVAVHVLNRILALGSPIRVRIA